MNNTDNVNLSTFAPSARISTRGTERISELPSGSQILVVGAGTFGSWTALHLLRKGYKVTLVDCWGPGNSMSSSGGESRLIRAIYGSNTKYFDMTLRAWDQWESLGKLAGKQILHHTGVQWFIHNHDSDFLKAIMRIMDNRGQPYDIIDKAKLARDYDHIQSEDLLAALVEKKAGYLLAREACRAVTSQFVKEGGVYDQAWVTPDLIENTRLTGVKINGRSKMFDSYVFACGPWLPELFPNIINGNKLVITRQEIHYFSLPVEKSKTFAEMLPWVDWEPGIFYYGLPGKDNRGFKVACDIRGEITEPTTMNRAPDEALVKRTREFLAKRFPALKDSALVEARVCQYSNTPDGNFIVDTHPDADNIWIIGGGTGHGFKHGPTVGEAASKMITGKIDKDPDFLLPD